MFAVSTIRLAILHWLQRRAAAAQVHRELGCMTDQELNDIGISRHAIARLAREAAAAQPLTA